MAAMAADFLAILLVFLPLIFIGFPRFWNSHGIPWNWPFLGMIPTVIRHIHRAHDRCTEILQQSGCTFFFRGVWFCNTNILFTADPANIHYIMSTNFEKYPKGPDFKYIFDILGDGIFNSDSDSWKNQRRMAHSLVHHPEFLRFLVKTTTKKIEEGLIPVLDSKKGSVIDLQDLFQRFAFDSTCMMVTGFDFNSLSSELPEVPFSTAMDVAEQVILLRHVFPKFLWELQAKLSIGQAKRLQEAKSTIDETIAKLIALKRETKKEHETDLITSYMNNHNDKFIRDTILNFMIAGRDTLSSALSWFFFCIVENPSVEAKIRAELNGGHQWRTFAIDELTNLVYLHGALCESLRLYPPVPFQHKGPSEDDLLPSGHYVNSKMKIIFSLYALGRMAAVWGDNCMEFKPERWITTRGGVKHEPSYKFLAFNAGPRTCLGKEVAFTQMKMVAAIMIHNYEIEQVGREKVAASASIILHMKDGFRVRVRKRWS